MQDEHPSTKLNSDFSLVKETSRWSYFPAVSYHGFPHNLWCSSWQGIINFFIPPKDFQLERKQFERTVHFLTEVPLFKKQLPKCELPKVAGDLEQKTWRPGTKLVKEGDIGRALFLIQCGKASVVTKDSHGTEHVRATLYPGDHFGGHSLTVDRPNVATIVASGPETLVTLSMSRRVFEESGLKGRLRFPKRPAIYFDAPRTEDLGYCTNGRSYPELPKVEPLTDEQRQFVMEAIGNNNNLRALMELNEELVQDIADVAIQREVPKGTVLAKAGMLGQEFFIIQEGAVDITMRDDLFNQHSAEATIAKLSMGERLRRKQAFLQKLYDRGRTKSLRHGHSRSTLIYDPAKAITRRDKRTTSWRLRATDPMTSTASDKTLNTNAQSFPAAARSPNHRGFLTERQMGQQDGIFQPGELVRWSEEDNPHNPHRSAAGLIGTVQVSEKVHPLGEVEVHFPDLGKTRIVEPCFLRPVKEVESIGILGPGESFGELSLIYNTEREATFKTLEDSKVYVIGRRHFKKLFSRQGPRFKEYCDLLDEVPVLMPLLHSERWELACNARGLVHFRPGERVLQQGKKREARMWYVIDSGSCIMTQEVDAADGTKQTNRIAELKRSSHFGERSLLRGDDATQVSVDAGPNGLTCLTFDGVIIRVILQTLFQDIGGNLGNEETIKDTLVPDWDKDVQYYELVKRNFNIKCKRYSEISDGVELRDLKQICLLGSGGFGAVFLVEGNNSRFGCGRRFALKRLSKGHIEKSGAIQQVCWERDLLSMVDSLFVIHLHKTFKDSQYLYLLLEPCLGANLGEVLHENPHIFSEDTPRGSSSAFYVASITAGLEHLHARHIVYRDLKPENVLLDCNGYAKLCDMGFARFVLGKTNTLAGTPQYMAPEMIDFPHSHDTSVDWWALGVVTFELMTGNTPWEDEGVEDPYEQLLAIRRSQEADELMFPFSCPVTAKSFVTKLLTKVPGRLGSGEGAAEIRHDAWFQVGRFDFDALHEGRMKSPFSQQWVDPPCSNEVEDSGGGPGEWKVPEAEEIFVFFDDNGHKDWDRDF